jgi:prepilin-type N-terminal cleavage/methylation domain-containing protein
MPTIGNKVMKPQGFTLTELLCSLSLIAILATLSLPLLLRLIGLFQLNQAQNTIALYFKAKRYDALGESLHHSVCIREHQGRVEIASTPHSLCEQITTWHPLAGRLRIDHFNTTLRSVVGPAGYSKSTTQIYRASWANTHAGMAGSWGQLGKIVLLHRWSAQERRCVVLFSIEGSYDLRKNGGCLKANQN